MVRRDPLLLSILAALQGGCSGDEPKHYETEGCMAVPETATGCAAPDEVSPDMLWLNFECGYDIVEVLGPGMRKDVTQQTGEIQPACCYPVDSIDTVPDGECVVGRPYYQRGGAIVAPLSAMEQASIASARAAAWARAAAGEHASVAAFARLSLQLMAHAAPTELLRDVHQAALDETRHAEACIALARHFGQVATLAEFPFQEPVDVSVPLDALAVAAVLEGCIAETLGVVVAREAMNATDEADVRAALEQIVIDESRHAALSYRIAAFALARGGSDARDAVLARLRGPWPSIDTRELALRAGVAPSRLAAAAQRGRTAVVEPALNVLLAA